MITICIIDNDIDYMNVLGRGCAASQGMNVLKYEARQLDFAEPDNVDLFLVGMQTYEENIDFFKERYTLVLTDTPGKANEGQNTIYRYERISNFIKIILYRCMQKGSCEYYVHSDTGAPRVIALCGLAGGVGTTSVAIGLGRTLARYHEKRCMYINFCQVEDLSIYQETDAKDDVRIETAGKFVYHALRENKEAIDRFIAAFVEKDMYGLSYFTSDIGLNGFGELNDAECSMVISILSESKSYDVIIMDIGTDICATMGFVGKRADELILVNAETRAMEQKTKKAERLISTTWSECKEKKPITVMNMVRPKPLGDEIDETEDEHELFIDIDSGSFSYDDKTIDISLYNSFGNGMKQLANRITGTV